MAEKSDFFEPELALAKLGIKLVLPQLLQNYSQVLLMLFGGGGIDKNVINEHHYELI
jgi:hypothetical protein